MRKIAIGDIHGCARTFRKLVEKLALGHQDELILLGDMIDRGPDTKGVLDEVLRLKEAGHRVVLIQGNHEELMLNAHIDFFVKDRWLNAGGRKVLASFGVDEMDMSAIDPIYWQLLSESKEYYEKEGFIFVHAGLNFDLDNPLEAIRDMRWIRDWHEEINYDWLGSRKVVHGHTPVTPAEVRQMHQVFSEKQVLDLDTGCVYPSQKGFGYLTAYDSAADELIFQEFLDD